MIQQRDPGDETDHVGEPGTPASRIVVEEGPYLTALGGWVVSFLCGHRCAFLVHNVGDRCLVCEAPNS